jgi:hypothetical protein
MSLLLRGWLACVAVGLAVLGGACGPSAGDSPPGDAPGERASPASDGGGLDDASPGREIWKQTIEPLIADKCKSCHLGERFGFASLRRAGAVFTPEETEANYQKFLDMLSLDAPEKSRLLAKALSTDDPDGMPHAGGAVVKKTDAVYKTLLDWVREEKAARCPSCTAQRLTSRTSSRPTCTGRSATIRSAPITAFEGARASCSGRSTPAR